MERETYLNFELLCLLITLVIIMKTSFFNSLDN